MPIELAEDLAFDFDPTREQNPSTGGTPVGSGLTDTEGNPQGQILDFASLGVSKFIEQYKNKEILQTFSKAFLDELTELESAFWQLYTLRTLDTAEGVQLTCLGQWVGEPRGNKEDPTYRRFIRVRILVNNSDGQIDQLYAIIQGLLGSVSMNIEDHYPASMVAQINSQIDPLTPEEIARMLRLARPAGVRLDLVYSPLDSGDMLEWSDDDDTPLVGGARGWGDALDPNYGGSWAYAYSV